MPGAGGASVVGSSPVVSGAWLLGASEGGAGSTLLVTPPSGSSTGADEVDADDDVPTAGVVVAVLLGDPLVGVMCTMPPGSTEMPGAGVASDAGSPNRTVPSESCSTGRDGSPGSLDTYAWQVLPLSWKSIGAALLFV